MKSSLDMEDMEIDVPLTTFNTVGASITPGSAADIAVSPYSDVGNVRA